MHGGCLQGASPSNQKVVALMALNDRSDKPPGTGPPDGIDDVGGTDAPVAAATVVDEAVAPDDTVELNTPGSVDPVVDLACLGEQPVTTSNNVTIETGSQRLMHS
ncbi:MAG: hypothetical protein LC792_09245 [Actinobacteria bacterium]|nr:hypothetical protein [Actinomycetota bacterium]